MLENIQLCKGHQVNAKQKLGQCDAVTKPFVLQIKSAFYINICSIMLPLTAIDPYCKKAIK